MNSDQERPFVCNAPGCSQVSVSRQNNTTQCVHVHVCVYVCGCNMKRCTLRGPGE